MTPCMALKKMTGNAVAYLRALSIERLGVGVDPLTTSEMHWRKRKM